MVEFLGLAIMSAAAVAWWLRSRRRARQRLAALLSATQEAIRALGAEANRDGDAIEVGFQGSVVRLQASRLERCGDRGRSPKELAEAALALAEDPLTTLPGALSLKAHGPRVQGRFVAGATFELKSGPRSGQASDPRLVHTPFPDLDLTLLYRLTTGVGTYLTEDHLHEASIDLRDLHGIALAVGRQAFDETELAAALAAEQVLEVEIATAAACRWLLIAPDFLTSGQQLRVRLLSLAGPAAARHLVVTAAGCRIL